MVQIEFLIYQNKAISLKKIARTAEHTGININYTKKSHFQVNKHVINNFSLRVRIISNKKFKKISALQFLKVYHNRMLLYIESVHTLPKDLLILAWNAKVGYSLDNALSHPFVVQAGTRSHCMKQLKSVKRD